MTIAATSQDMVDIIYKCAEEMDQPLDKILVRIEGKDGFLLDIKKYLWDDQVILFSVRDLD